MIIETIQNTMPCSFDENAIIAINDMGENTTRVYLYGGSQLVVNESYFKMLVALDASIKKRNFATSSQDRETSVNILPLVEFGGHKFSLLIHKVKFEDGFSNIIKINASFLVNNETLKVIVEGIGGVEKYNYFNFNKYETDISVGRMFDVDIVAKEVSEAIKQFLTP